MPKKITVVELENQQLAAVELLSHDAGMTVSKYVVRQFPDSGCNAAWLRTVWTETGFVQNRVILSLPGPLVKFKSVNVPALSGPQLEAAVKMELTADNSNDFVFKIISLKPQAEMMSVKVIIIDNTELTVLLQLLSEAGLKVIWSGFRARGIHNFLNFNQDFLNNQPVATAYLDFRNKQTEFGVCQGEQLIFNRIFIPGLNQLRPEAEIGINDLLEEIHLSLAAYLNETGSQPPAMLGLFGKIDSGHFIVKRLTQAGYRVVTPKLLRLTGVGISEMHLPELAPLIGLAFDEHNQEGCRVYSKRQLAMQDQRHRMITVAKIALIGLFFGAGIWLGIRAGFEKDFKVKAWLVKNTTRIMMIRRRETATNRNLARIRRLENWLGGRADVLEFLRLFQANLPEGTIIVDIIIEDGAIRDISGVTPVVSVLLQRLRQVAPLRKLKLKGNIAVTDQGEMFHLEGPIFPKERLK